MGESTKQLTHSVLSKQASQHMQQSNIDLDIKMQSLQGSHCNIMSKHSNQMIEDDNDEDDVLEPT